MCPAAAGPSPSAALWGHSRGGGRLRRERAERAVGRTCKRRSCGRVPWGRTCTKAAGGRTRSQKSGAPGPATSHCHTHCHRSLSWKPDSVWNDPGCYRTAVRPFNPRQRPWPHSALRADCPQVLNPSGLASSPPAGIWRGTGASSMAGRLLGRARLEWKAVFVTEKV